MHDGIREADVQTDASGVITNVRLVFGPHHGVELHRREDGGVDFVMGATHHGFLADASVADSELEGIINDVREAHPDLTVDCRRQSSSSASPVCTSETRSAGSRGSSSPTSSCRRSVASSPGFHRVRTSRSSARSSGAVTASTWERGS